jgi:hypothetical protein
VNDLCRENILQQLFFPAKFYGTGTRRTEPVAMTDKANEKEKGQESGPPKKTNKATAGKCSTGKNTKVEK